MIASLGAVAGLACFVNRKLGLTVATIALLATFALFWSPAPITEGNWYMYSDGTRRFVATIPPLHTTQDFIALLFAVGSLVAGLIVARREVTLREVVSLILCVPLVVDVAGSLAGYWYPFGP